MRVLCVVGSMRRGKRTDTLVRAVIDGMPFAASVVIQDDIIVSGPVNMDFKNRISTDFVDEIVVESAAHPADAGPAQGATINIIHRAGSARTLRWRTTPAFFRPATSFE